MGITVQNMFLTPNEWSRPTTPINKIRGIVIHWVANPMTSAAGNRNFFESRKDGTKDYGSAHYIAGQEGEVILCMPESEMAYHVGSKTYTPESLRRLGAYPNNCTIGIECCHLDWTGKMNQKTYNAALELAVQLLKKYGLNENDLWLHRDVVGWKDCHRWFVNSPAEWTRFKQLAGQMLRPAPTPTPAPVTKKEVTGMPELNDNSWEIVEGRNAVDVLAQLGLINTPDSWKTIDKLSSATPTWLTMLLFSRLSQLKK